MDYLIAPDRWEWLFTGNSFRFLLEGFAINVQIAVIAILLSLVLGLLLALGRVSKNRALNAPTGIWIDVWRNLPLVFIMFYLFLSIPSSATGAYERAVSGFLPDALSSGNVLAAILGLTLYNSAVIAEIMRAGIQSLERGQGEAAAALGLTRWQSMRLVILPQGLRRMVPATVSQLITLNKDTTLVSLLAVQEVMRHGRILSNCLPFTCGITIPLLQVFLVVGLMFVIVNFALSRLSRRLELRERQRGAVKVERAMGLEDQVAAEADVTA